MYKVMMLLGIALLLTVSVFALPSACADVTIANGTTVCLKSVEVAPNWVYTHANEYVESLPAMRSIEVAPNWVYTSANEYVESLPTLQSIEVAPYWVYEGPHPK